MNSTQEMSIKNKTLSLLGLLLITISFIAYPLISFIFLSLTAFFYKKNTLNYIYILSFITMFFFFSSLKPFGDISEYIEIYNAFGSGKINLLEFTRFGYGIEILYPAFMNIVGEITDYNDQVLILSTYGFILILISLVIKDSKELKLFFFSCITLNLCFTEATSYFIRQIISVLLFLYALESKKNNKKYFLFLVSLLFHLSSLINITLYILYNIFKHKNRITLPLRIFIFLIIMSISFSIFFNSVYYTSLENRVIAIINNDNFNRLPTNYILLTLVNFIFIIIIKLKYRLSMGFKSILLYKEVLLFLIFISLPTFPNRFAMILFAFPAYFLLSLTEKNLCIKSKKIILVSFLLINIIPFLYLLYNVTNNTNLYTFMENKPFTESLIRLMEYFYNTINNGVTFINTGNK